MMLKAMIRIQWKAAWHLIVVLAVAALALPVASVRLGWKGAANLPFYLTQLQLWGLFYPGLACVAAIALAAAVWASDRRGHHIYALLLPVPRWRYVLLRYLAGLVLLIPIALALWLGTLLATTTLDLPPGIRVFPHAITLKFTLTLLVLFGFAFAVASASGRTLGYALRGLGLFLAIHLGVLMLRPGTNLIAGLVGILITWPGPLAPLGGRWMLIDV
jgi:ABC-type transport system involved in multi-copper enzyme maturation permease subunit